MNEESTRPLYDDDIPASLRRRKKEPQKSFQLRFPLSQWEELAKIARDYDQDVSTFLREAVEDWLRRARKVIQTDASTRQGNRPRFERD
jgi:hypothetical protein